MTQFWPQYAVAALYAMNLAIAMDRHGTTVTERRSVWPVVFGNGILLILLYFGGFWKGAFG